MCFAYLDDVSESSPEAVMYGFAESKWFTRGWTLQEVIAPAVVVFLNQNWGEIGTKLTLGSAIAEITKIPVCFLEGTELECASIAQRMSWASTRETTRTEDLAYCLMGIFRVHICCTAKASRRSSFSKKRS